FSISAVDDVLAEPTEAFNLSLAQDSWSNAAIYEHVTYQGTVETTITDNDVAPTIATSSLNVSEEGLAGGNEDTTGSISLPSNDTTNDATRTGTIDITGNGTAPLTAELSLTGLPTTLESGGVPITWSYGSNNAVILGKAGNNTVIQITLNDGSTAVNVAGFDPPASLGYQVALLGPVDHPLHNVEDTLSFNVGVTLSDGVNLPADSGTIGITIEDDMPITSITNGIFQNSADTVLVGNLATIGADIVGAHVTLTGTVPTGLTSGGDDVTYSGIGTSTITATAGDNTVFTLTAHDDGTYNFTQSQPLDLSVIKSDLTNTVGPGGKQPAYYLYEDGTFGSVETKVWGVKITGTADPSSNDTNTINPSQGMGVHNNLFQTNEKMHFEFDDEGISGAKNNTYIVKIGIDGLDEGESVKWIAHYTSGPDATGTATVANLMNGNLEITSPSGTYLDYVDMEVAGHNAKVRITSVETFTLDDSQPKVLPFGFTATDGDNDSVDGSFTITAQNSSHLIGTAGNDALAGGHGANIIDGGGGDDIIIGGGGDDQIHGGAGADTFNQADYDAGKVVDYNSEEDMLANLLPDDHTHTI
ncbi:MAG: hypothetical protein ABIN18_19095, partial [Pseudomonadota bacterium]